MRIRRDKRFVWPDRYYIWTYYPKSFRKSIDVVSKGKLYAKHYTYIPYFSRQHAKHVAVFYYGKKALHYVHVISGKRLIHEGITTFNMGRKKFRNACFIEGQVCYLRQWAYPPEYQHDKHRRRKYACYLNKTFEKGGKNAFNKRYWRLNYGSNYRRISATYRRMKYNNLAKAIWRELEYSDNT